MALTLALWMLLVLGNGAPTTVQAVQSNVPAPMSDQIDPAEDFSRRLPVSRQERSVSLPSEIQVVAGDTYGKWANSYCNNFSAWRVLASVNGWPERRIPVGATASIVCKAPAGAPASASMPVRKPAPAPAAKAPAGTWVHPLASGARGNSPNCWHTSQRPGHEGIDIAQPSGTPIRSVTAGTVYRKVNYHRTAGNYVTIRHANNVFTQYHHLASPAPVSVGQSVAVGQTIGRVGRTGNATGNHLHFEVMLGYDNNVNPGPFMRIRNVDLGC